MRRISTQSFPSTILMSFVLLGAVSISACVSDDGATTDNSDSAVEDSLLELNAYSEEAGTCMDAMAECMDNGGDRETCRANLEGCLPETRGPRGDEDNACQAPEGDRPEGGMGGERPEGLPPEGEMGPEGAPPEGAPPEGGMGERPEGSPPEGERPEGERPEGGMGGERPEGEMGGERPEGAEGEGMCRERRVSREVIEACVAELGECAGDEESCREAVRDCVHDAVEAQFQEMCAEHLAACDADAEAPEGACERIAQRCEEGVPAPRRGGGGGR